jgi:protein TonB
VEDESKSNLLHDSTESRPRRHVASFAASIVAHLGIIAVIMCFASPLARGHSEWVLAYLVEGADGSRGRGDAASGAPATHVARGTAPGVTPAARHSAPPPKAARKSRRRRIDDDATDVASIAPTRPVALARPAASAHEDSAASHGDTANVRPAAVGSDGGTTRGGAGSPGVANGGAGDDPNSVSVAHADYASNPPPYYPASARRHAQQGTVTVRVLVGADGSVERAEISDSSGFDSLDDAALETVRSRWRFVPARHGGIAVESWVLVPIRFALLEANAVH